MTTTGYKRLQKVLILMLIVFAGIIAWATWNVAMLRLKISFAADQTEIFDKMRDIALHTDPVQAAECLQYAVTYYPSGTKQEAGSQLDRMVERQRAYTIHEIIGYLRSKTGQDFGDDPHAWIEKLSHH